jgi:hypothetical protein
MMKSKVPGGFGVLPIGRWKHLGYFLLCVLGNPLLLQRCHFMPVSSNVYLLVTGFVKTIATSHLDKILWEQQREQVVSNLATRVQIVAIQGRRMKGFAGLQKRFFEEHLGISIKVLFIELIHGIHVNAKASSFSQLFGHL